MGKKDHEQFADMLIKLINENKGDHEKLMLLYEIEKKVVDIFYKDNNNFDVEKWDLYIFNGLKN